MQTTRGSEGQVAALMDTAQHEEAAPCDWRQLALGIAAVLAYTPQTQQDMLGEVAHELKSAVGTLRSQAALLDEAATARSTADSARELTACIVEHADLMAHVVGAILDVQRLRLGKVRLDLRPVDFVGIAERSVTDFQATAPETNVDVVASECISVNADQALLSQALACLLKGAAKSGPARKMELRISPDEGTQERLRAVLTVCLSVRNFQPEDDEVVQSSSRHAALDLELFIAREIIRLHGGDLWVVRGNTDLESMLILVLPSSLAVAG
jgi:two-component system CheB/CheR fusion protein